MPRPSPKHVTIIGAGKIGSAMALALQAKGFTIDSVVSASLKSAATLARQVRRASASTSFHGLPRSSRIIAIAVPDDRLSDVASTLAKENAGQLQGRFVFHTSGVHPAAILNPLERGGAAIAAIHPIQSFRPGLSAKEGCELLRNIYFGLDASGGALKKSKSIVAALGGTSVVIPTNLRPLYHLTCVFSSGHLVTLLGVIEQLSGEVLKGEAWQKVFSPLLQTSFRNTMHTNPRAALTGPVRRGDKATIALHLKALETFHPEYLALYKELTRQAKGMVGSSRNPKKKR
jgi:predicted short-subunit dehydrogenase-like oxidoreductase (DUF2520 family)